MARRDVGSAAGTALRVLAASAGGYAFASAAAILLSLLPGDRAQATLGASLAAFVVWAAAAVWAFAARSPTAACLGVLGGAGFLVGLAFFLREAGL